MFLYDVKRGQSTPYLTIPGRMIFAKTKQNWFCLKVLPQLDAILMVSDGQELILIRHLSQLIEPAYWDIDAVLKDAVNLGKTPNSVYDSFTILSLEKDKIMISGRAAKGETFTSIFSIDGTTPPVTFTGILGVAWAPDDQSFLGIKLTQSPSQGSGSSTTNQPGYFIQPIRAGAAATPLYEIPPTCGLLSKALDPNRTFQERKIMSNCINDATAKRSFPQIQSTKLGENGQK